MPIEFHCEHCNKLLRVGDDKAGKSARCPQCSATIVVPSLKADVADVHEDYEFAADSDLGSDLGSGSGRGGDGFSRYSNPGESQSASSQSSMIHCPLCGETISHRAVRCRYCGEEINGGGGGQYYPQQQQKTCGLAIASMVLGIIGLVTFCIWVITIPCSLLAVILGAVAMRKIKSHNLQGQGMAIAGLVCGIIAMVFWVMVVGFAAAAMQKVRPF